MKMVNEPSTMDMSESGSDSDSNQDENEDGSPMMSIFASYYGIEEPVDDSAPKGTIDDSNFQSDSYVKKLLINESVEGLIGKDTEMVHEIRTLDGEMQKLVYDNYNKFITATETIKEMKNDVYGMDNDMESVRTKMAQIAKSSAALDEVLQEKRTQVDKLVRVRRLLHRLEFLSELPERLAAMIDHKQYKEAVQLYNKTITVLTRHQHVLSFKNIKERTELMMKDLTGKVLNMLDDVTLEDVKLTQYVTVLRLMRAPRMQVMTKLLAAHKHRSMRMITQFNQVLAKSVAAASGAVPATTMSSASTVVLEMLTDISNARKFAQSLVVGLIEACKGIYDLFQAHVAVSDGVTPLDTASASETAAREKDARVAFKELHAMIAGVMGEYTKSITAAFRQFFSRHHAHFLSVAIDYREYDEEEREGGGRRSSVDESRQSNSSAGAGSSVGGSTDGPEELPISGQSTGAVAAEDHDNEVQQVQKFKTSELLEERNSWMLLARQSINDVMYLDSTQYECKNNCNLSDVGAYNSSELDKDSHAVPFADAVLQVIATHCDVLQAHRITCYINSIAAEMPNLQALCNVKSVSASSAPVEHISRPRLGRSNSTSSSLPSSSGGGDPVADRQLLQKNTALAKKTLTKCLSRAVASFAEAARDAKCLTDICEVAHRDAEAVVLALVSKHCNRLADSIERLCGVANYVCVYNSETNALEYSAGHVHHNESGGGGADDEAAPDDAQEIFTESEAICLAATATFATDQFNEFKFTPLTPTVDDSGVSVKQVYLLLFSSVLRRLLPVYMDEVACVLSDQELPGIENNGDIKSQCVERLDLTSQLLTRAFLETNANFCAQLLTASQYEIFAANYGSSSSNAASSSAVVSVSDKVLTVSRFLDMVTVLGCVMLNETPPALKMPAMDRDLMRRGGTRSSVVGGGGGHMSLQLDIERLFLQRIRVFDHATSTASLDFLVGTIIKAALKATQEAVRFMSLNPAAYIHLQANVTFLKQVASCLVKDVTDCDNLVEQILGAVFSRYLDANDIANAADGNEVSVISRAVSEAFHKLGEKTVLVTRSN